MTLGGGRGRRVQVMYEEENHDFEIYQRKGIYPSSRLVGEGSQYQGTRTQYAGKGSINLSFDRSRRSTRSHHIPLFHSLLNISDILHSLL